jgi:hypothetical protein
MIITIEQQLKCAARELALRKRCYPVWVRDRRMKQSKMDEEIAGMEAIVATLQRQKHLTEISVEMGAPGQLDLLPPG